MREEKVYTGEKQKRMGASDHRSRAANAHSKMKGVVV
jgi:hypothetical protein